MRLVSFMMVDAPPGRRWRFGAVLPDGTVLDAALVLGETGHGLPADFLDWFDLDGRWLPALREAVERASTPLGREALSGVARDPATLRWLAPVPRPGKIVAVGLNYRDHAAEARLEVPAEPVVFAKFSSAAAGSGDAIVLPSHAPRRVDFEAELVVVIGRRIRRAGPDEARAAILGYCNGNDVSARDLQKREGQWVRAKSCDTFAPMGPWILTSDEAGDPHALDIRLTLNGTTMQSSNTREMIVPIPDLLSFVSQTTTLEPGDVIFTGTPPGVGFARRPPVYLQPGDEVVVEIGGLGRLVNPVVVER